jgi:hypothetical protein
VRFVAGTRITHLNEAIANLNVHACLHRQTLGTKMGGTQQETRLGLATGFVMVTSHGFMRLFA